jgi:hypothetical protein
MADPVPSAFLAILKDLVAWLDDAGIPAVIVGGVAAAILGRPRATRDPETQIDLFVSEPFEFDSEYDAALVGELQPGLEVRFVRIETLVRMKEAAGREKLRYFQSLSLRAKLEAVEGMADIVRRFRDLKRKGRLGSRSV